jgi:hypothetical protein
MDIEGEERSNNDSKQKQNVHLLGASKKKQSFEGKLHAQNRDRSRPHPGVMKAPGWSR